MATRVFDLANYSLSVYALPTFVMAAAILLLGVLVLVRERISLVSVSLFLIAIIFSFWFFCFSWMYCSLDEQVAWWWAKMGYVAIPLIPSAVYQFAVVELRIHQQHKRMLWSVWMLAALFSAVNVGTDAFIAGVYHYGWGYYPKYGWLSVPFLVFLFSLLSVSMRHYWIEYRKAQPGIHKQRIRAFGIAWVIAYLALVDILPKYGVAFYPFGYIPIFVFVLLSARAILRYRLVDITPSLAAQQIIDTMNDALIVLDHEGIIRLVNRAARGLFNRSEQELLGMPVATIIDGAFSREQLQKLQQTEKMEYEIQYRAGSGNPRILSFSSSVMRDWGSQTMGIVCFLRDVTERLELRRKIEESQEKYQNIVENSLDGIVVVQDGKLVYANPSAARIFEHSSPEQMKMIDFSETVAPASRPFVFTGDKNQTIREEILRNYEMKGLTKHGKIIDLEVNARLITWNARPAVQASFRDITDRKMLEREQALWLWEQETLSDIDRKLVSMVSLQRMLDAISMNAKSLTRADFGGVVMLDADKKAYTWKSVKGNLTPVLEMSAQLDEERSTVILSKEPIILKDLGQKPTYYANHFPVLHVERLQSAGCFPLFVEGEIKGQLVVGFRTYHAFSGRDIRLLVSLAEKSSIALANAELYENLVKREQELKLLSGARIEAQEEERRRISREIHDSLGQMLTAVKFNVEMLEDIIPKDSTELKRLNDTKALLDLAMAEAREISYNLMPSVLEDFGLVPALQLLCEQFSKWNQMKIEYHTHALTERLEPALEVSLYRIVQEALNNIAKHAEAKEASVQVVRHGEGVRLTIEDSGRGFDPSVQLASPDGRHGMGLVSIRERAASFKGTVNIDSAANVGTTIVVEIPLEKKHAS